MITNAGREIYEARPPSSTTTTTAAATESKNEDYEEAHPDTSQNRPFISSAGTASPARGIAPLGPIPSGSGLVGTDEGGKGVLDAKAELKELNDKILFTLLRAENCTRWVTTWERQRPRSRISRNYS